MDAAKYQETRARMMEFAKKAAKDQQTNQQANGQGGTPAQPAEPVADGRRRQIQPVGRAADIALRQHSLEQDQQVEVGAR